MIMRNLAQYPITSKEIETFISYDQSQSKDVFGTKGICYDYLLEFLKINSKKFDTFLDKKKV